MIYLAATPTAVSAAFVKEEGGYQCPIYYVSEALMGAKGRYTQIEKVAYALLMASRKLRHYFLGHAIIVPSSFPIREVLGNKEATGRIAKWATKLTPFALEIIARTAIKSQILADFMAEWQAPAVSYPEEHEGESNLGRYWTMRFDGSKCLKGAGAGVVLISPEGKKLHYAAHLDFDATNKIAEYEAFLLGL
jgi:hypothetical protein